jgi:hypothetical protein
MRFLAIVWLVCLHVELCKLLEAKKQEYIEPKPRRTLLTVVYQLNGTRDAEDVGGGLLDICEPSGDRQG